MNYREMPDYPEFEVLADGTDRHSFETDTTVVFLMTRVPNDKLDTVVARLNAFAKRTKEAAE